MSLARSASGEVETVLKSYLAALSEKDDDIVKLYEDNHRLRALAERSVRAKDGLEAKYRTTALLVTSLQAELHAKTALLTTQQDENRHLREVMADCANVLHLSPTTWPLDAGPHELVACVTRLQLEHDTLSAAVPRLQHACDAIRDESLRQHVAHEAMARRALCEGCAMTWQALSATADALRAWTASVAEAHAAHGAAVVAARDAAAQREHALCLQHVEAVSQLHAQSAAQEAQLCAWHEARLAVVAAAAWSALITLAARACAAEAGWCNAVRELCSVATHAVRQVRECDAATLRAEQAAHAETRALLLRRRDEATRALQRLHAITLTARKTTAEYAALQTRHRTLAERTRRVRRAQTRAERTWTAQLTRQRAATQAAEARVTALTAQLTAAQHEACACKKQLVALQRTTAEARSAEQARDTERNARDALQTRQVVDLCTAMQRAARLDLCAHEASLRAECVEHERELRAVLVQEAHAQAALLRQCATMQAAVQDEVRAWVELADSLREQLRVSRDAVAREQAARRVLEAQQTQETQLLRRLVRTPPVSVDASRGAQSELDEVQAEECAWLRSRVEVLEQVCRKSAAVIAELREAVHRERACSTGVSDLSARPDST